MGAASPAVLPAHRLLGARLLQTALPRPRPHVPGSAPSQPSLPTQMGAAVCIRHLVDLGRRRHNKGSSSKARVLGVSKCRAKVQKGGAAHLREPLSMPTKAPLSAGRKSLWSPAPTGAAKRGTSLGLASSAHRCR